MMMSQPHHHSATNNSSHLIFRRRVLYAILALCISFARTGNSVGGRLEEQSRTTTKASSSKELPSSSSPFYRHNCTSPAIEEFPRFPLTPEQRAKGGVLVPLVISLYLVSALGIICDDFFVPALEIICHSFHMSNDVAGATFMAAGTSAPEFFTNIMGTFVTKSDLGIGTIVGSAVFNILGIVSVCGLFAGQKIVLSWFPITRDCIIYGITVILLIIVLIDEKVFWYESLIMLCVYLVYIVVMAFNGKLENWAVSLQALIQTKIRPQPVLNESTPLHNSHNKVTQLPVPNNTLEMGGGPSPCVVVITNTNGTNSHKGLDRCRSNLHDDMTECNSGEDLIEGRGERVVVEKEEELLQVGYPWDLPSDESAGCLAYLGWAFFLPINLIFFLTIPDVRRGGICWNKLYPISFVICIAWIGILSYIITWMITIIGFTIGVPDSVMGLSFLAVGTSIPEVFSSLIVSRQGKGSMAVSNSIGSNTFDILVCLGVPWMSKALISGLQDDDGSHQWMIRVNSEGLTYTVISLLLSLVLLYIVLLAGRFVLSKTMGMICLLIYAIFLSVSLLFELNVFFVVNLPTCPSDF